MDTRYSWNADDSLAGITHRRGGATLASNTYSYDGVGNRSANVETVGGSALTSAVAQSATLTYDSLGPPTTVVDPSFQTTQFSYDARDGIARATDQLGKLRDYSFDANGDPVQNETSSRGAGNIFDSSGYIVRVWSGGTWSTVATVTDNRIRHASFALAPTGAVISLKWCREVARLNRKLLAPRGSGEVVMPFRSLLATLAFVPISIWARSIERPTPNVGDECRYDVLDEAHGGEKVAQRRAVVTAVDADSVTLAWTQKILVSRDADDLEEGTWIYDRDLNVVQRNGRSYIPPYPTRFYPLTPGAEKKGARSTYTRQGHNGEVTVVLDGKVSGWNKVDVPAGSFDTLKIVWSGAFNVSGDMKSRGGSVTREIVLTPATWCAVSEAVRNTRGGGGAGNDRTSVLTGFRN